MPCSLNPTLHPAYPRAGGAMTDRFAPDGHNPRCVVPASCPGISLHPIPSNPIPPYPITFPSPALHSLFSVNAIRMRPHPEFFPPEEPGTGKGNCAVRRRKDEDGGSQMLPTLFHLPHTPKDKNIGCVSARASAHPVTNTLPVPLFHSNSFQFSVPSNPLHARCPSSFPSPTMNPNQATCNFPSS